VVGPRPVIRKLHVAGKPIEVIEGGEYDYLFEKPLLDKKKILWKEESGEEAKKHLEKISGIFGQDFLRSHLRKLIMQYAEEKGKGEVLWPLRYALSGREKSPDPFTLIDILNIEESESRVQEAIRILSN